MSPILQTGRDFLTDWNPAPVLHLNSDLDIEYVNQSAKNAFCKCSAECNCSDIICSCSEGTNLKNVLPSIAENSSFNEWLDESSAEIIYYFEDTLKDHVYHFTCRKLSGGCLNIYGSDITEVKKMHQEKEDIERIVKHDLRNPLNGILGLSELLKDETDPEVVQEMIEDVRKSCDEMLYLIDHTMDLYKMEEGIYQLEPVSFDILDMIRKLHSDWHAVLAKKNMTIIYSMNGESIKFNNRLIYSGEIHHIRNMIANLVKNAIEASPDGGRVNINVAQDASKLLIDIHNAGIIPEKIQNRFFDKYITSSKKNGTGLGTYSANMIAAAHGGDIRFSTSQSEGTHLYISLPINT